ncbi:MAG TPA: hypothetical protein VHT73_12585 [Thermodesulfobacteriota bacterium]|nr:hypothetical protein [Thermodesulfobacteriota bacterium]
MQVLDYIKIVSVSDITFVSSDILNITFNIVYSHDSTFTDPKRGVFTINLSDFIGMIDMGHHEVEEIASHLTGQVLIRGKEKDRDVAIFHLLGMSLSDWLTENVLCNFKSPMQ